MAIGVGKSRKWPTGRQWSDRGASATAPDTILGVIWIQPQDGRVANLLTPIVPATVLGGSAQVDRIAHDLLEAAVRVASAGGARLIQSLLEIDAQAVADQLERAGFRQIARLQYLVSAPESFPTSPPAEHLQFEPWSAAANDRLESVVERSYVGTRDCPQLNGVRLTSEVLAGYRSAGPFDPARWLLVRDAGQDIGCLFLVEHPQKIWELAYMGLVPEVRGNRWGLALTRHGQWLARQAVREPLRAGRRCDQCPGIADLHRRRAGMLGPPRRVAENSRSGECDVTRFTSSQSFAPAVLAPGRSRSCRPSRGRFERDSPAIARTSCRDPGCRIAAP